MKHVANDQELINLLMGLKSAESNYPADLLSSRRETFVKQVASVAVSLSAADTLKYGNSTAGSQASPPASTIASSSIGALVETILIAVIVVQVAVAGYLFRDKIADFFSSIFSPRVEQVSNPPDSVNIPITVDAVFTETPTPELTDTSVPTDAPAVATLQSTAGADNGTGDSGNTPAVSTPQPTATNPGLHLGQTPKPGRTQPVPTEGNKNENKGKDK